MADVHTPEIRSYNMSCIHASNTKPEEKVRKYLFAHGFRYRKNDKRYPGKPDIVLPKYKTCIFINGCFWHMHQNCKYFVMPKSNVRFWKQKLQKNVERDQKNYQQLQASGWQVLIIWECQLKKSVFEGTMNELINSIILYQSRYSSNG